MDSKIYSILVNVILLISTIHGAAIKKTIDDSNYYNGNFLKNPVDKPRIVGGTGKIVKISTKPSDVSEDNDEDNNELSTLLNRLYDTLKDKVDHENAQKQIEKKREKNDSKREKIKELEDAVNDVLQSLSNEVKRDDHENSVVNEEKVLEKSDEFKDFTIVKKDNQSKPSQEEVEKNDDKEKFISYKDFRNIFYHTFLNPKRDEKMQHIILTGRKDNKVDYEKSKDDKMDTMKDNDSDIKSDKRSITDIYEELKHETKLEKEKYDEAKLLERVKSEVDRQIKKEKELEKKKRELVSLLNEVTNDNSFIYRNGKVALGNKRSGNNNNEEEDFEKLLESSHKSEVTRPKKEFFDAGKTFLDEFKKTIDQEYVENDTKNDDLKRKERLQNLLNDFLDILKEKPNNQKFDNHSEKLEDVESKNDKSSEAEKELLKILEGFKIFRP